MNDKRYEDADHHFYELVEIHYAQDRDSNKHSLNGFFSDTGNTYIHRARERTEADRQTDRAGESEAKSETVRARDKKNDRTRERE